MLDRHAPHVMIILPRDATEPAMTAIISHLVGSGAVFAVAYRVHEMQVRRIDTQWVMAPMIDLEAVRDGAVEYAP